MKTNKKRKRITLFDVVIHIIIFTLVAIVLYPLVYVISCSVSEPTLVASGKVFLLPKGFTLAGYQKILEDARLLKGYANSLFYTFVGTLINLIVTVPAGYVLSKKEVPGTGIFLKLYLVTMYFSGGMIPSFLLIKSLHLYNTRAVLLIVGAFSMYNCIICRSFFNGLPKELEEAAHIDGCSVIRTFLTIVLPLSKALLGVMVLYFAVGHWNSYFNAMIYTYNEDIQPLQLFLRRILVLNESFSETSGGLDDYVAKQQQLAALIKYAVIVVSSLPLMIVYPFLQKFFEKGVMIGSVKG